MDDLTKALEFVDQIPVAEQIEMIGIIIENTECMLKSTATSALVASILYRHTPVSIEYKEKLIKDWKLYQAYLQDLELFKEKRDELNKINNHGAYRRNVVKLVPPVGEGVK
jgi:hypothetical protein